VPGVVAFLKGLFTLQGLIAGGGANFPPPPEGVFVVVVVRFSSPPRLPFPLRAFLSFLLPLLLAPADEALSEARPEFLESKLLVLLRMAGVGPPTPPLFSLSKGSPLRLRGTLRLGSELRGDLSVLLLLLLFSPLCLLLLLPFRLRPCCLPLSELSPALRDHALFLLSFFIFGP